MRAEFLFRMAVDLGSKKMERARKEIGQVPFTRLSGSKGDIANLTNHITYNSFRSGIKVI